MSIPTWFLKNELGASGGKQTQVQTRFSSSQPFPSRKSSLRNVSARFQRTTLKLDKTIFLGRYRTAETPTTALEAQEFRFCQYDSGALRPCLNSYYVITIHVPRVDRKSQKSREFLGSNNTEGAV